VIIQDWLRRNEIEAFAITLAQDLGRRFPPKSEERTDKGARNQLASIADKLYAEAAVFGLQKKLGVYGKAKLGNAFRWQLRQLGYSEPFIDDVAHGLVVRVARGR